MIPNGIKDITRNSYFLAARIVCPWGSADRSGVSCSQTPCIWVFVHYKVYLYLFLFLSWRFPANTPHEGTLPETGSPPETARQIPASFSPCTEAPSVSDRVRRPARIQERPERTHSRARRLPRDTPRTAGQPPHIHGAGYPAESSFPVWESGSFFAHFPVTVPPGPVPVS